MAKEITIRISAKNLTKAEISKARRQLDGLEKKAGVTSKRMGGLRGQVDRLSKNFRSMNPLVIGAGAAVAGLTAAVAAGIRRFAEFEASMTRIETLVGLSREQVASMTDAVRELGPATGRGPQELSEALFQITSAGLRGQTALDTLEASAKAAAIGLGDTATVADIATSAMNAFGADVISSEEAVSVLLKAVREGKTSPEELATSLGRVIPIASQMGVSFQEVSGIVASLTRVGFSAAEGVTGLRQSMLSILNPSQQAEKILSETSLSMDDIRATLQEKGALAAFEQLRRELDDQQLAKFIGRAEGLNAVLAITGDRFQETAGITESTADTFGVLDEAMDRVDETSKQRADRVKAVWTNAFDAIGEQAFLAADTFLKFGLGIDPTIGKVDQLTETERRLADQNRSLAQAQNNFNRTLERLDAKAAERVAEAFDDVSTEVVITQREIKKLAEDAGGIVEPLEIQRNQWTDLSQLAKDYDFTMLTVERRLLEMEKETAGVVDETVDLEKAQQDYNAALAAANDLAQLIGGNIGQLVGQTLAAGSALQNLSTLGGEGGILGGIGASFQQGKGESSGILGLISGVAGAAGPIGAIASVGIQLGGALIESLGRGADDVMDDVTRDIGAGISEGLAERILESGENAQLFLKEIFAEGNLGIDELARETGDLFSFFERGEISEGTLIRELKETLPLLIQNFDELGPAGKAQIDRITSAAGRLGIELGDIDELLQKGFAPATIEEMAAQFDLTGKEIRELGKDLGVNLQTNLEQAAAQAGLTVDEFRKLQDELGQRLGKEGSASIEEVTALLESMGLSAGEAAEQLGIGVGEGAAGAAEGTKQAGENLTIAANEAQRLKEELTAAAREAGRINASVGGGGGQQFRRGTPGADFMDFGAGQNVRLHGEEAVISKSGVGELAAQIAAAIGGAGAMNVSLNVTLPPGTPADQANQIADLLERNVAGLRGRAAKSLGVE